MPHGHQCTDPYTNTHSHSHTHTCPHACPPITSHLFTLTDTHTHLMKTSKYLPAFSADSHTHTHVITQANTDPHTHRCVHHLQVLSLGCRYTTSHLKQPLTLTSSVVKHDLSLRTPPRLLFQLLTQTSHVPYRAEPPHPLPEGRAGMASLWVCGGAGELTCSHNCPSAGTGGGGASQGPRDGQTYPLFTTDPVPCLLLTPGRHKLFSSVTNMMCDICVSHSLPPWHLQALVEMPTLALALKKS